MKLFLIMILTVSAWGQNPKSEPAKSERLLTESESLKIENAMLRVALAQKKFDIEGYQKAIAEPAAVQHAVFEAVCMSVGIPREKVETECSVQGFGADGSALKDADGKPMPRRVWWNKPVTK